MSAINTADLFLFRSGRGRALSVYLSDVNLHCTLTPPRTIRGSFRFLFLPSLFDVVAAVRPFRVRFGSPAVWGAVGVALHGVVRCSNPDDQMRYAIRQSFCRV